MTRGSRQRVDLRSRRAPARRRPWWERLPHEELLDLRFCDLRLGLEGTALEARLRRLYLELDRAALRFRPYVWLSTDWFTPDGLSGFAVPFYLAHPRLIRVEHREMLEVEGGTHEWCMKLLRHETGHALDNAYRLHRKKRWREIFGRFSEPYRDFYNPRPASRDFVQNLDHWYAQSHPAEDYAETFAVWLQPASRWRSRYAGWPALKKLEGLDGLLREVAHQPQPVRTRERPDSLPTLRTTLREHYRRRKTRYEIGRPTAHDRYLLRLFSADPAYSWNESAASFLRQHRGELRGRIADLSGQHRYVVEQALNALIARCRETGLRLTRSEGETRTGAAVLLTLATMKFVQGRRPLFRR